MVGKIQKRDRPTEKTQTFNVSSGAYEYLCCIMQMHIIATARRSYFYIFPLMTPRLEMTDQIFAQMVVQPATLMKSTQTSGVNLVQSLGVVNPVAEIFDSSRKIFRFSGKIAISQAKILTTLTQKIVFSP